MRVIGVKEQATGRCKRCIMDINSLDKQIEENQLTKAAYLAAKKSRITRTAYLAIKKAMKSTKIVMVEIPENNGCTESE